MFVNALLSQGAIISQSRQFLTQLGIQHPIIQAPMAGVSTPRLAATVSNAGGLGSLGIGASTAIQARQAIMETRALTTKPFNVNVFCHVPAQRNVKREAIWIERLTPLFAELEVAAPSSLNEIYQTFIEDDGLFNLLLALRPTVVSFHFGLPTSDQLLALRKAGIVTLATATNLEEALLIEQAGVDAVVAQGIEAGGHRGIFNPEEHDEKLSCAVLTQLLVQRTHLPVIAAGGIVDGQGIKTMLNLGAVAVQLGTAFILCPESAADEGYRNMLKSERAAITCLTRTLSGRPARGIINRFIRYCEALEGVLPADYPVAYDAAKQLFAAGNDEFSAHWAGQSASLVRELPAEKLIATLVREMSS